MTGSWPEPVIQCKRMLFLKVLFSEVRGRMPFGMNLPLMLDIHDQHRKVCI